jgi:hypothetical protein
MLPQPEGGVARGVVPAGLAPATEGWQHRAMRPRRLAVAALLVLLAACEQPARRLAAGEGGPEGARALAEALAARFGPARRDAALEALRPKLVRAALVPSRVFDDAAAWPARQGERRAVELTGFGSAGAYHLAVRREAVPPLAPGEYRGRIELRRGGPGRYEWNVVEELSAGPVRVAELSAALDALLRGAEASDGPSARQALIRGFPRSAAPLGRLLRIETLALAPEGDATRVELGVRLVPDALKPTAPRLASFVRRYFGPMRLRAVAADAAGRTWWTVDGGALLWTVRLRVRGGSLVPLQGPAEVRVPEQLRVLLDYETRMGRFHVGVKRLEAGLTLTRTPAEKGFVLRFLREPEWELPFLVETVLGGPLRHPFEAPGSEAGWWARDQDRGPTLLVRRYRARVRESFVLRWFGGLTDQALSEFRSGAEAEYDAWAGDCLVSIRDDLVALAR